MNDILLNKIEDLQNLCLTYSVKSMYAFGSVCTDRFNNNSDIDFLISFDNLPIEKYTDNYFDLHNDLEKLFERKIDLLTDKSLSNPYFIKFIEQTKKLIYAA
ncbi:MAG: nucleotidyltransferase domain-containing protein [Bacteroidetes bacterium]|nr:nucleotidyltransferase domain-containing protein [Bacteroidota bacterium]